MMQIDRKDVYLRAHFFQGIEPLAVVPLRKQQNQSHIALSSSHFFEKVVSHFVGRDIYTIQQVSPVMCMSASVTLNPEHDA